MPVAPDLSATIREYVDSRLRSLRVMLPGRVKKYDPATQLADVEITLRESREGVAVAALPTLYNVPVVFPRTHTAFFTLPIKVGDLVEVRFSDRSLDAWLSGKSADTTDPQDTRAHDLSDAVCTPGLYPTKTAIPKAAAINADDITIGRVETGGTATVRITPTGDINLETTGVIRLGSATASRATVSHPALKEWVDELIVQVADFAGIVRTAKTADGVVMHADTIAALVLLETELQKLADNFTTGSILWAATANTKVLQ